MPRGRRARPPGRTAARRVTAAAAWLLLAACGQVQPAANGAPAPVTQPASGELAVHFVNAGQGDATLLVATEATVLVDTGRHTATDVVDYLDRHGVEEIDVVAITHPHADHIGQFDRVLERFDVAEVWWSPTTHTTQTFDRALGALEASDAAFEEPAAGDTTDVGPLRFEFLNPVPGGSGDDLHDRSLAFRASYGEVSFLFTGDAEAPTEARMLADHPALLAADVYQVGHHGSATSSSEAFLDAVSPRIAVYSAGSDDHYGHPHEEVLDRFTASGVTLYGTDVHGSVIVTVDGGEIRVHTATGGPPIIGVAGSRR